MIHLLNALHKTTLTFVDKTLEHGDIWSFRFSADRPIKHIAGQHAAFIIKGVGYHVLSLASAPEEGFVKIGTHVKGRGDTTGSKYKQALMALQPGNHVSMYGPILNFTLEKASSENVFLAQGIGITPFRSMLVHNARVASPVAITLIHSDGPTPTYHSETDTLAAAAHYPQNPEEFTDTLSKTIAAQPNAKYYLSGSPGFIKATKATLKKGGVLRAQMKTDSFWGY